MRPLIVVSALCLAQTALAAEAELSLGSGLNYSTGTYGGSSSTHILTIPLTARYESESWTLRATVPYLRITRPSGGFPGGGRVGNRSLLHSVRPRRPQNARRTVSGIG